MDLRYSCYGNVVLVIATLLMLVVVVMVGGHMGDVARKLVDIPTWNVQVGRHLLTSVP